MKLPATLLVMVALCGPALADDQPPLTRQDVQVHFPTGGRYFPEAAMRKGIGGMADVICTISATGALVDCAVTSEAPVGLHFGDSALKLAKDSQVELLAKDGSPTPGRKFSLHMNLHLPN
jgi:Gram-negative bacterial TonB protein C-terminal